MDIGCVSNQRAEIFAARAKNIEQAADLLQSLSMSPSKAKKAGLKINQDGRARSAFELLSYPGIEWADLSVIWPQLDAITPSIRESVETDARYSVYLERQERDIRNYNKEQALNIPRDFDFSSIGGLSNEIVQKLTKNQPLTLAQASNIDGVTPAALMILIAHIKKKKTVSSVG